MVKLIRRLAFISLLGAIVVICPLQAAITSPSLKTLTLPKQQVLVRPKKNANVILTLNRQYRWLLTWQNGTKRFLTRLKAPFNLRYRATLSGLPFLWRHDRHILLTLSVVTGGLLLLLGGWILHLRRAIQRSKQAEQTLKEQLSLTQARCQEAEAASRCKSEFLARMSHEIRTPLHAIIGLLEMELRQQPVTCHTENLTVAFDSARTLRALIGDILDLHKIESGRWLPLPETTLLPELVERTVALFRNQAAAKGLAINVKIVVDEPCVQIDPLMVTQILTNLLGNAIKFTDRGEVGVTLMQRSVDEYRLDVSDSGCGLTQQQQRSIFEPFVQVCDRQQQQAGSGLGLNICRRLARLLGGELKVTSRPGAGSVFSFLFQAPRADCAPSPVSLTKTPATDVALTVLVAEDHAPNRLLIARQLEHAGHQAVVMESATEALKLWEKDPQRFDLIITDCNMPGMNGFQFARAVRQREKIWQLSPVTIYGLTASAESHTVQRCLAAGMNQCLCKPIDLDTLLGYVARCSRHAQQEPQAAASTDALTTALPTENVSYSPLLLQLAQQDPAGCSALIDSAITTNRELIAAIRSTTSGKELSQLGHKLKGGASILNAKRLATLALALEKHQQTKINMAELIADIAQEIIIIEKQLHHFQHCLNDNRQENNQNAFIETFLD